MVALTKVLYIMYMLKLAQIFVYFVMVQETTFTPGLVNFRLGDIYSEQNQTLKLIDQAEVRFRLSPLPGCNAAVAVMVVLSTHTNIKQRNKLRASMIKLRDTSLIFLLGEVAISSHLQAQLDAQHFQAQLTAEHMQHQDILQITVADTYKTAMYKVLASYVWINRYCPDTKLIMKTDDNASVDLKAVLSLLQAKYPGDIPAMIECPSPLRNLQVPRHNHTNTISGKWTFQSRDHDHQLALIPNMCFGWFFITTPEVGLALAIASAHYKDTQKVLVMEGLVEDCYITGVLRERLPWVKLNAIETGPLGRLANIVSHCPILSVFKNVFLNGIVLEKGSSNVAYVNSPRFFVCMMLDMLLQSLEKIHPALTPAYMWTICDRDAKWTVDVDQFYNKYLAVDLLYKKLINLQYAPGIVDGA